MRLQRDVAEILERQNAEPVRMSEDRGHGKRDLLEQAGDVRERKRRQLDRSGMNGEHERPSIRRQDTEVPAVRRIAGQRHDPGLISCQTALAQKAVDAIAQERAFHRPLFVHASAETTSRSVPFGRTTSDRRYVEPAARRTPSVTTHSSTITSD